MSIVRLTQMKCERGTKQTMGKNILFNFLMCVYQIETKQTISTALFRFICIVRFIKI